MWLVVKFVWDFFKAIALIVLGFLWCVITGSLFVCLGVIGVVLLFPLFFRPIAAFSPADILFVWGVKELLLNVSKQVIKIGMRMVKAGVQWFTS